MTVCRWFCDSDLPGACPRRHLAPAEISDMVSETSLGSASAKPRPPQRDRQPAARYRGPREQRLAPSNQDSVPVIDR